MQIINSGISVRLLNQTLLPFGDLLPDNRYNFYSLSSNNLTVGNTITLRKVVGICYRVELDDEESVVLAATQSIVLLDGSVCSVKNLNVGTSLYPLYTKFSTAKSFKGYELYWSPTGWHYTHRTVGKWKYGDEYKSRSGKHLHHKDFNKLNNDPNNLELLLENDHLVIHQDYMKLLLQDPSYIEGVKERLNKLNKDPEFRAKQLGALKKLHNDPLFCDKRNKAAIKNLDKINNDPVFKEILRERSRNIMLQLHEDPEFVEAQKRGTKKKFLDPEYRAWFSKRRSEKQKEYWDKNGPSPRQIEAQKRFANNHLDPEIHKKRVEKARERLCRKDITIERVLSICEGRTIYGISRVLGCNSRTVRRVLDEHCIDYGSVGIKNNHCVTQLTRLNQQEVYVIISKEPVAISSGVFILGG